MNESIQIPQMNTEKKLLREYKLKSGFTILRDQKNKILAMPLKNCKVTINQNTNDISVDVGQLMANQRELTDYLICLFFEGQSGEPVNLDTVIDEEYSEMEAKIKEINPFKVFDIKPM